MVTAAADGVASSIDRSQPIVERIMLGLETTLLGMGTVFAVLVILMGVLYLFRLFFYTLPNRREKARSAATAAAQETEEAGSAPLCDGDGALIAAITAAIAVYLDAEAKNGSSEGLTGNEPSFRVVNFRRR